MKNILKLIFYLILVMFCFNCTSEDDIQVPIGLNSNSNIQSIPNLSGDWKMVVNSVDYYEGIEEDRVFINVLTGQPIPSGIETTNTTFFNFDTNTNKIELHLPHGGWSIWEANGFYPIQWDFNYKIENNLLMFEGMGNMFLSSCQIPDDSVTENKFSFEALGEASVPYNNYYFGYFVWTETYDNNVCLKIFGSMEVYKFAG